MKPCRRCSECKNYSHHWIESPGPMGEDGIPLYWWVCKHCDATGKECDKCEGYGTIEVGDYADEKTCPDCNGEGVIFNGYDILQYAPAPSRRERDE